MKVLIIQNNTTEGPGTLRPVLDELEIDSDTIDLDKKERVSSLSPYSAVFVFGGPDSANDGNNKISNEVKLVRQILKLGIPYLGFCLGMQVLSKAAGGKVVKCRESEAGWRDREGDYFRIHLTDIGRKDHLFRGISPDFPTFQLHGEMVEPSAFGEVLAFGYGCPVQVVKEGKMAYGFQGHPELTTDLLKTWQKTDPDLKLLEKNSIYSDFREIEEEYTRNGMRIFSNFINMVRDD